MDAYSLSEARANLPLLLTRVADGEEITITRHGHPVAVVVGHDRWMKTARYEVLEQARELRKRMDELRRLHREGKLQIPEPLEHSNYDFDGHVASLRENDDPWDEIERGDD